MKITFWLIIVSVIVNGMVAGLSFDTAVVKLPARKKIGVLAYSDFARGNDLGNGIIVYPVVGVLSLLIVLGAAFSAYLTKVSPDLMTPLIIASIGAVCHTLCTAKAAPIMLSLKQATEDEKLVAMKLNRFAFWHGLRATLQFATFVVLVWTLVKCS